MLFCAIQSVNPTAYWVSVTIPVHPLWSMQTEAKQRLHLVTRHVYRFCVILSLLSFPQIDIDDLGSNLFY